MVSSRRRSPEAARHNADGVICEHIHHASIRALGDITYVNCGDWVESCTAILEHYDGRLELVRWNDDMMVVPHQNANYSPLAA